LQCPYCNEAELEQVDYYLQCSKCDSTYTKDGVHLTLLSEAAFEKFIKHLENPPEPNEKLKALFKNIRIEKVEAVFRPKGEYTYMKELRVIWKKPGNCNGCNNNGLYFAYYYERTQTEIFCKTCGWEAFLCDGLPDYKLAINI